MGIRKAARAGAHRCRTRLVDDPHPTHILRVIYVTWYVGATSCRTDSLREWNGEPSPVRGEPAQALRGRSLRSTRHLGKDVAHGARRCPPARIQTALELEGPTGRRNSCD